MVKIRVKEYVINSVIKAIKRHFNRIIKLRYDYEQYQTCKNNIDLMYEKIAESVIDNFNWSDGFGICVKSNILLIGGINHVQ
ncbi:hypothetical protein L2D08_15575 [Domibacillus sp. PGB-M46]|uniref:hypothetical protein n=1 Tax=Domibacillus sp. PGB-M46 TaxID=2910255 RepID=UPI001F599954|nr:hypothetical protein [Domibacillus sp. PGB-M46]MCI2255786.1 hypothetical protein [Domibacillus sp. PGB-M46]